MMKNKNTFGDLNDILFEQLGRLNDKNLKGEELKEEMQRSKAVGEIAKNIISAGSVVIQAMKVHDNRWNDDLAIPKMLGIECSTEKGNKNGK